MSEPLVTIITPTYNRADLLPETVESVLRQDYPKVEYIVLDDGSSDDTSAVIKPYQSQLQYFYHENMGETATVNKGFTLAKGEIICVINSDDPFFANDAISIAVQCLKDNGDALMAYPDWVSIDANGNVLSKRKLPQYTLENMLTSCNVALGPAMFIRKSTIDLIGPRRKDIKYIGDLDYSFRMSAAGKIVHIPHFLATHREHAQALSSSAKGGRMTREVAGLGERYVDHPSLPLQIRTKKRQLLASWYVASVYFAGKDVKTVFEYLMKAVWQSPAATFSALLTIVSRKVLVPFYKIWGFIKFRGKPVPVLDAESS